MFSAVILQLIIDEVQESACIVLQNNFLTFSLTIIAVCNRRKYDNVTPLLRDLLYWLYMQYCIEYKIVLLVYKSLHGAGAGVTK